MSCKTYLPCFSEKMPGHKNANTMVKMVSPHLLVYIQMSNIWKSRRTSWGKYQENSDS